MRRSLRYRLGSAAAAMLVLGACVVILAAWNRPSSHSTSGADPSREAAGKAPVSLAAPGRHPATVMSLDDEAIRASLKLASASRESGDAVSARQHLDDARARLEPIDAYTDEIRPAVASHLAELGSEFLALREEESAEQCLNQAVNSLESRPLRLPRDSMSKRTLARALALLSESHRRSEQFEQASQHLQRSHRHWTELFEHDPDEPSIHLELARSYLARGKLSLQLGDPVAAENSFELARQIEPENAEARQALFDLLSGVTSERYQAGDYAGAWEPSRRTHILLEEMAAADRNDETIHRRLGSSFFYLGDIRKNLNDLEGAAQYFEKSLVFDPGNGQPLRGLADCLNELGDRRRNSSDLSRALQHYERANEILAELVRERPKSARDKRTLADSFDRLGSIANALGDSAKGRDYFDRRDAILAEAK